MTTTPGLDNPDIQYGDVGPMRDALKIQGIGKPPMQTGGHPVGAPTRNDQLPDFVTKPPSARPGEPLTAGSDVGPGPDATALETQQPEDLRELTLQFLATAFGNQEASQMLDEYRAARQATTMPATGALGAAPAAGPMSTAPTFDESSIAAPDDMPRMLRQPQAPEGDIGQPTEDPPGPQGEVGPNPVDVEELVPQGQEGT